MNATGPGIGAIAAIEGGRRLRSTASSAAAVDASVGPLISIAIVTFNAGATLQAALDAIVAQRYPRVELIVVDGGSTDGTVELLRTHCDVIDYWRSEPDGGIYPAMNKARQLATGDWLLFVGADDLLYNVLHKVAPELRDPDTAYYGEVVLASSGVRYDGRFSLYKLMLQNICHQSIFYPRRAYAAMAYDEGLRLLADHKYNIELIGNGYRLAYLPLAICLFNDRGASSAGERQFHDALPTLVRRNFGFGYYLLKRLRNLAVRWLKPRR